MFGVDRTPNRYKTEARYLLSGRALPWTPSSPPSRCLTGRCSSSRSSPPHWTLRLTEPGLFIDADVPALTRSGAERQGIIGQVGVELSALLLIDPARRLGVRAAAEALSRAPSSISDAFAALRAAGLVDAENEPAVPDLFWELAEHWKPTSRDVASIPSPNARDSAALRLGMEEVESTVGWALTTAR
ncbi:hypothetical protein [Lentzea cavernae]|uniref:MarR family protein n=1 Tax=Lentzea cavernae TaxID=2020703 RepID=A0ABQ3MX56_9PSEU|nr:hypothetical protein [Lentzea cavernae]GHH61907.1 hypothetical protein GCM10017774_88900 [Lentzea cavernae]